MDKNFSLTISAGQEIHDVSSMLFGIFLEDINFACDGGLNANMVNNSSFDGVYLRPKGQGMLWQVLFKHEKQAVIDRLRYWKIHGGQIESRHEDPAAENSWYARVSVDGQCRLENRGYNGGDRNSRACAMAIQSGQEYEFSCWARIREFRGSLTVSVVDEGGSTLSGTANPTPGSTWQQLSVKLPGSSTGYGKLVLQFDGQGSVDLDGISLMTTDTWGRGDPKWSQGRLRRDMVEALRDLKPRFMRFPGGCIVEGDGPGNEYNWKDTVGPVLNRRGRYNLWAQLTRDGGYFQSCQVGFHEFFLLCEDLGMEPLPTLFAGLNCQMRSRHCVETHSSEFQEQVVQNYLDLIEYANGDPGSNPWAAMRAQAGHPEPFHLKYIGVGNENFGPDYLEKFEVIKKAIDALHPGITCVLSCGVAIRGKAFSALWEKAHTCYPDVCVDEHCYSRPGWFIKGHTRYDHYSRAGAKVYMGEYAANFPMNAPFLSLKPNCYQTALAEAVFLAGLERNSDVVAMSSYAPLFSLSGGEQWAHNLINFNPAHVLLTANYFVQKMYSGTVGEKVVEMRGELPEGVYASATETKEKLILKLINTNSDGVHARLTVPGIPDGQAHVEFLQSDDPQAANALSFRGEPRYVVEPQTMVAEVKDGVLVLELQRYGIYVVTMRR